MYIKRSLLPKNIFDQLLKLNYKCYHYSTFSGGSNFTITKQNIPEMVKNSAKGMNGSSKIGNYWCDEITSFEDLQSYKFGRYVTIDDDIPQDLARGIDAIQSQQELCELEEKLRKSNFTTRDYCNIQLLIDSYERHGEKAVRLLELLDGKLRSKAEKLIEQGKLIY